MLELSLDDPVITQPTPEIKMDNFNEFMKMNLDDDHKADSWCITAE